MRPTKLWQILLAKAKEDEYVVDHLIPLEDSPDESIGFHLQQAAEKILKALLAYKDIQYRYTHNLDELFDLLRRAGELPPQETEELHELTPYATALRYDVLPHESEEFFDRQTARRMIADLRAWVESRINALESSGKES